MFEGKTFLVVDDEPDLREILRDEFEFEDAIVSEAPNGKQAFEIIKTKKFDAVLTDIRMPGGDGVTLAREIKSLNYDSPVVILITGFADLAADEAFDIGVEGFFTKPFNLEAIRSCVQRNIAPRHERWKGELPNKEWKKLSLPLEFSDALSQARLSVGRGGAFFGLEPGQVKTGDYVEFSCGTSFKGWGQVKWVRSEFGLEITPGIGIEFLKLEEKSLRQCLEEIEKALPRAFIPRK